MAKPDKTMSMEEYWVSILRSKKWQDKRDKIILDLLKDKK